MTHPQAHLLYWASRLLANKLEATWGEMSPGANSAGGFIAGMLPFTANHASEGLNAKEMWENPRQAYVLFNVEPEYDCANPFAASKALKNAQSVVAFTAFDNPLTREYADVMLPIASHIETRGTYINALGDWQSFYPALSLQSEMKPGWKVLRVLANLWHVAEFNYNTTDDIIVELKAKTNLQKESLMNLEIHLAKTSEKDGLIRLAPTPLYATDAIVRRAPSLQQTKDSVLAFEARINSFEANKRNLKMGQQIFAVQGEGRTHLPLKLKIDENIPNGAVVVASGIKQSQRLGAPFTPIELVS
jgi:NADH-quinone oxidoreductase subunit G